jgi:hypothetical protein
MQLEPAASVQVDAELGVTTPAGIDLAAPVVMSSSPVHAVLPVEHSPPDFQSLNATFLI